MSRNKKHWRNSVVFMNYFNFILYSRVSVHLEINFVIRSSLFWYVTQCWLVVSYRYQIACRSHLQGSSRNAVPKRRLLNTNHCCITSKKSKDFLDSMAEVRNNVILSSLVTKVISLGKVLTLTSGHPHSFPSQK